MLLGFILGSFLEPVLESGLGLPRPTALTLAESPQDAP